MDYIKRIRDLREDHDKTQQQIADFLGTSQTMYARYERGANELPIRHLVKLCEYYQVSADYILGRSNRQQAYAKSVSLFFWKVLDNSAYMLYNNKCYRTRVLERSRYAAKSQIPKRTDR